MLKLLAPILVLAAATAASAHSWYPFYCCSERDCEPVYQFRILDNGNYEVWTRNTHILVPSWYVAESPDEHVHICTNTDPRTGEIEIICFFAPPVQM